LRRRHIISNIFEAKCDIDDTNDTNFRLTPFQTPEILNSFRVWTDRVDPNPMAILSRLRRMVSKIECFATDERGQIDYIAAEKDPSFLSFDEATCELQGVSLWSMDDRTKLSFGINLYNLMVKHAIIKVGISTTYFTRLAFYKTLRYNIGGTLLSCDDVEHGILRANTRAPKELFPPFGKYDSRRELARPDLDPRIHFALNCGSKSCPSVEKFSSEKIEEELKVVARGFCEDDGNVSIDFWKHELTLSMIFYWYRADFSRSTSELPRQIVKFLSGTRQTKLQEMIDSGRPIKVKFKTYEWSANASRCKEYKGPKSIAARRWSTDALFQCNLF